jgi:hypothetical protein
LENDKGAVFFAAALRRVGFFLAGVEVVMMPNLQDANIRREGRQTGTSAPQQNHSMGTDALTRPHEAQTLSGCGLHANAIHVHIQQSRNALSHLINVRSELGGLKANGRINVDHAPAVRAHLRDGVLEKDFAVNAFECGIGIREVGANVTHGPGPKQCVTNHMKKDVCIAVTHSPNGTGNLYASQPKLLPLGQLMNVVTVTDAEVAKAHAGSEVGRVIIAASNDIVKGEPQ